MRAMRGRTACAVVLFCVALPHTGCSRSVEIARSVVQGEIKYNGTPIQEGMIRFIPSSGPSAQGIISGGKYRITAKGGVSLGTSKVEIEAFEESDQGQRAVSAIPEVRENVMRESKQFLPSKYNTSTRLKFDVEAGEENDFSIDLAP